ncbi:MAG: DUF2169 domain-containing protein [Acidobacteria bacterium]|nr:DUF2169 domain-containing protein [Acidobacteriota bacterium]
MPEEPSVLGKEQPFPRGDSFYADDADRQGSLFYESDFAFFKPRADLLLVGKCHTSQSKPARMCPVTFQVGEHKKTLSVFGNRRWEKRWFRHFATDPEPFTEMELRYENSFGGENSRKNPVGKGSGPIKDARGNEIRLLPNIEDPVHPIESPKSSPEPAGFGPLGRMWQTRHSKTGTYTGNYRESRWPWFPEDFDWSHFNAAPPEMQVEGYLRGDEKLYFENLHPEHSQYHSQLPGINIRCFLNKRTGSGEEETGFEEVSLNLDTLWVDMEAEKLVLVWRGWAEVLSEDYEEVQDLFIMSEPLERQPASKEACYQQFLEKQAEEEKAWAVEPEEPEAQPEEDTETPSVAQEKPDIDPAYLQAQTNAILAQMGVNPQTVPPEAREKQSRLIQKLTETDPAKVAEMQQKELDDQMREAFAKLDLDPDNLPPVSAKAKAEQLRFMKELGLKSADIADNPEVGKIMALMGAALPKMGLNPENLTPLIEQTKKQQERFKKQLGAEEEAETGAAKEKEAQLLTRDNVQERAARGESFTGEDLHGLDLSGLDLSNLDFSGAKLAGAILNGAKLESAILSGADLTEADLTEADCTGANLAEADLTKAKLGKSILADADCTGSILTEADLAESTLADAVFEKARMAGAVLDRAEAAGANFSEADLTGCSFLGSSCSGADFSKAVLDNAVLRGADLREASMEGAVGRKIDLTEANLTGLRASDGCDFTGGIFWNSAGGGSIWDNADLTGSDFRGARMEGAVFTAACLKQADLSFTDMKFSRFDKADLLEARMVRMNLFQGNLEKANLTGADLSGSNMYGVEFLDAVTENIRTDETNLKMSKLQEKAEQG